MKKKAENWKFSNSLNEKEQIEFFEKQNNASVSVLQKGPAKTIVPYYISQKRKKNRFVSFVYLGRFFCVKNISRLFGKKGRRKKIICEFCLEEKKHNICGCFVDGRNFPK